MTNVLNGAQVIVDYLVREKVPYETWADEAGAPSKHSPELMDNQERMYPQNTFDASTKIGGRPYADGLSPPAMLSMPKITPTKQYHPIPRCESSRSNRCWSKRGSSTQRSSMP